MLGYWDKPEETARAFEGGWFHSGDVGVMDEEGYLFVVDRIKDVINTGGVLVASREVEDALFTHPAVSEVAVIAVPDPKWGEAVAAVVVLRAGHGATEAELIGHARGCLAPFKLPKRVIFAGDLPRNTAGKLLKRELRSKFGGTAPRGSRGRLMGGDAVDWGTSKLALQVRGHPGQARKQPRNTGRGQAGIRKVGCTAPSGVTAARYADSAEQRGCMRITHESLPWSASTRVAPARQCPWPAT